MELQKAHQLEFSNGIFNTLKNFIFNAENRAKGILGESSFSRNRKLSFEYVFLHLMLASRNSIQTDINQVSDFFQEHFQRPLLCTRSAFSQARSKIHPEIFNDCLQELLEYYAAEAPNFHRWKGYQLIGVDSSILNLPLAKQLENDFALSENGTGKYLPAAKVSVAFDLLNQLPLNIQIANRNVSDMVLGDIHINELFCENAIFIFDRGYPSYRLFQQLIALNIKFVIRINSSFKRFYDALKNNSDLDIIIPKGTQYYNYNKMHHLEEDITGLRIVKVPLSVKTDEILCTNLTDREEVSLADLKWLYNERWGIEEKFKAIKNVYQLEYFSGKTTLAIHQDIRARYLLYTIESMLYHQLAQPELERKFSDKNAQRKCRPKHKKKINRSQLYRTLKDAFHKLIWLPNPKEILESLLMKIIQSYDIIRNNRSFPRKDLRKLKYKPLNYRN